MKARGPLPALMAIAAVLLVPAAAGAETFRPTRFDDPTPGACKPKNCSLREAVVAANKHPGLDTVRLADGEYRLDLVQSPLDDAREGDLDVTDKALIRGRGAAETTVHNFADDRLFQLGNAPATLRALTVKGGSARHGGGLYIGFARTTLEGIHVEFNSATEEGGGIVTNSRHLTITRSTVSNNLAGNFGGGLASSSADDPPDTHISRSTFFANRSHGVGGGIALAGVASGPGAAPVLSAVNSTFNQNVADLNGGGISVTFSGAEVELDHATVDQNTADVDANDSGEGGGVHQFEADLQLNDSIVARNGAPAPSDSGAQCLGTVNSANSLFQVQTGISCTIFGISFTTGDAKLGVLDDHGGPSLTVNLLTGSPAIAIASACPATDQRGKPRPATGCDDGAYERKGP